MDPKVGLPVQTEDFLNIQFKGFRGRTHIFHDFTMGDLPFMNPYDWISLLYIAAKDVKKFVPIYEYLRRMIKCYILEMAKMDVEIMFVLKRKPTLTLVDQPQNIENLKGGLSNKKH
ncbi:unnamed protein product [Lactuca saligna]|uniref:Uncharacterized protein n=1 Tax=Lactuca saligna TaxID=75948 RepID=A0AA35ZRL3_LACSI|nr:unnamed protein product [Lactuca saligna]